MENDKDLPEQLVISIIDNFDEAVVITDNYGSIQFINSQAEQIFTNTSHIIGKNFSEVILVESDDEFKKMNFEDLFQSILSSQNSILFYTSPEFKIPYTITAQQLGRKQSELLFILEPGGENFDKIDDIYIPLQKVWDSYPDAMRLTDKDGRIVGINKAFCSMTGKNHEFFLKKHFTKMYSDGVNERVYHKRYIKRFRTKKILNQFKQKLSFCNGSTKFMEILHSFVDFGDGSKLLLTIFRDLHEQKIVENSLQEPEEHLTNIFENSVDIVFILDLKGNMTYVNNAAEEITGISKSELIGTNYKSYVFTKDQYRLFRAFQGIYKTGKSARGLQFEINSGDGRQIVLDTSVSPIKNHNQIISFCCISRDVTLRAKAERALLESEERFRSVAETASEAIISINKEGNIIFWNRAAEQIFHYSADEVIGAPLVVIIPENNRGFHIKNFRLLIQKPYALKTSGFRELRAIKKNGEEFSVEISQAPWKLNDELYFTIIIRDITQRKRDELERDVLYKITENVSTSGNLEQMIENIYQNIKRVIYAENCYIALFHPEDDSLSFPLFVDQRDQIPRTRKSRNGITEYVLNIGKPLLLNAKEIEEIIELQHIEKIGTIPCSWLGVPLFINSKPSGVLAVQSYSERYIYTEHEKNLLMTIGSQVAYAIERKQAYEAIRASEKRFRTVIDTAQDGIYLKNAEHKYTHVNTALSNFFNLPNSDFIGKTDTELFGEKIGEYTFSQDQTVLKGNIIQTEETGIYNGELVTFHVIKYPIKDDDGKIIGLCGISRDITARKKMENAIEEERERLRTTLKSIGDGVITTDLHNNIVLVNRAAEKMVGWLQEDAEGKKFDDIFCTVNEEKTHNDQDNLDLMVRANKIFNKGQYYILESRNGTKRIITLRHSKIKDRADRVLGAVHVFRDETETVKFRSEQQKADKLESIGILAGGIAHDFNNLLTAILSNVSLIKYESDPDSETHEILTEVEKASLRARDLTQQLLTFSRGGLPVKKKASIAELIRESADFALSGSNVYCDYHFAEDLSPVEVDIGQISQVINNLIINADEAMPGGGVINLSAENTYLESNQFPGIKCGNYVKIVIADHGIGINKSHLPKIFDPYFSTKQKGSGLGLATCYAIIKKHQGFIGVDSELGKGTRFIIYLPASTTNSGETFQAKDKIIRGKGKILLMDDEKIVRDAAGKLLIRLGYQVVSANNGEDAIELYQNAQHAGERFDAVILDLTVPGAMGGKDCMEQLIEIDPDVRAVVSSGYSNDPVMADFRDYGFLGVAKKPYRINELGEILHSVLTLQL